MEEFAECWVWLMENIYLPRYKNREKAAWKLMKDLGNFTCEYNASHGAW